MVPTLDIAASAASARVRSGPGAKRLPIKGERRRHRRRGTEPLEDPSGDQNAEPGR